MNQPTANDSVPCISFTNLDDLINAIVGAPGDALIVNNVSPMDYETLSEKYESSSVKFRLSLYQANSQCLWITIPDGPHEHLHAWLYENAYLQMCAMGLKTSWVTKAATRFESTGPYFNSGDGDGGGEGDSAGGPRPDRRNDKAFPTLLIEAGYSQSLEDLRVKAHAWFSRSHHDIKIVILAKFTLAERKITLERWEERQRGQSREGATTCWAAEWIPVCQQVITITAANPNLPVYQVTSGDLVLDFRLLFLRNPRPGEGDITITVADLQEYAQCIWEGLGYI